MMTYGETAFIPAGHVSSRRNSIRSRRVSYTLQGYYRIQWSYNIATTEILLHPTYFTQVWCSLSVDMAPSCDDTARKQIYQQVAIRDFGMHQIFTRDNSWRD